MQVHMFDKERRRARLLSNNEIYLPIGHLKRCLSEKRKVRMMGEVEKKSEDIVSRRRNNTNTYVKTIDDKWRDEKYWNMSFANQWL